MVYMVEERRGFMDLRQLEIFCAVAAEGSVTRGAERCHISQSAASQQVKALENEFDCELLHRHGRGFDLTPAGDHLARGAKTLLSDAERLRYEVEDIAYGRPSKLRVGYLNHYDGYELAGAVGAFARRHPSVDIEMRPGSHDAIYRLMLGGEVDMVFNDKRRKFSDDYVNRYLMTCYDYVEVSEASPLAARQTLGVADLAGQALVCVAPPSEQQREQSYYRDVLNFNCNFCEAETLEQARFLVAANRAVLPIEARDDAPRSGSVICRIPLVGVAIDGSVNVHLRHDYYAFWAKAGANPYCEEFADILEGLFQ